jgi:hypothetical protein
MQQVIDNHIRVAESTSAEETIRNRSINFLKAHRGNVAVEAYFERARMNNRMAEPLPETPRPIRHSTVEMRGPAPETVGEQYIQNLLSILRSGERLTDTYHEYALSRIKDYRGHPDVEEYFEGKAKKAAWDARQQYFDQFKKRARQFGTRPIK